MTKEDLLELEKTLVFDTFDAWNVGQKIVEKVKKDHLLPVRIRIVLDNDIVFQYLMPGKKGVEWLNRKQKTVEKYHHSSYFIYLDQQERHVYDENDDSLAICGGGFPLRIQGKLKGCIIVSGLKHEEDHQLIVDVLKEIQKKPE